MQSCSADLAAARRMTWRVVVPLEFWNYGTLAALDDRLMRIPLPGRRDSVHIQSHATFWYVYPETMTMRQPMTIDGLIGPPNMAWLAA